MDIKILSENLYKIAKQVKGFKYNKTFPILNYALVYVEDGCLRMASTNLGEGKISDPAPIILNREFSCCVPIVNKGTCYPNGTGRGEKSFTYHPFIDFAKVTQECHYSTLEIEYDPKLLQLTITADNSRTVFECMSAAEFPAFPKTDTVSHWKG